MQRLTRLQRQRNHDRSVKILRVPRARLQLPRNLAFRGDLQLALFPLESAYFDYADVCFCINWFRLSRSRN
ncbi:hypothetical protein EV213_103264 [Aureibacillus halotolerans]|uniref:Uncharacterized protein n=1 Tax=Aureibacillus halotolerans TaxID=1508390 RepID=A0A4R6U7M1_9BACI|nr:hypothetical protein EV213_103264 [Aureibacillus halotolerans]